jgi:hypothetical protein
MNRFINISVIMCLVCTSCKYTHSQETSEARIGSIRNTNGLQLLVMNENASPALFIILPGHPTSDRSIVVLFPEHVTAVKHGQSDAGHLYLYKSGPKGDRPKWKQFGRTLEYQRELPGGIHLLARAILDEDGVRFHYEFINHSTIKYDMIQSVTDPRLTSIFKDVRLERTYVHHSDGFELLASETPKRLTIPLNQWLPARYLASFTWPVPKNLIEIRDGITYYNKSRAVDQPFIATISTDGTWIVASFSRETGNVWSNPELTCQHVDPQTSLLPGQSVTLEMKILVLHSSLNDAFQRAINQRDSLK